MDNIKAAIFDLDGTLIDSMYVWSKVDNDFLAERGIAVTKEYTDKMRSMYFETAASYTKNTYNLSESVEEIMQIWLDMAHFEYANNVRLKPYAYEYVMTLKQMGIKLGIATSNSPYLLKPCLDNNGLSGVFDCICYTSEVGVNKSNPDIYLYTAKKLGASVLECAVYEDIIEGLKSASAAGMKTVGIFDLSNIAHIDEIKKTADIFAESYEELLDRLNKEKG